MPGRGTRGAGAIASVERAKTALNARFLLRREKQRVENSNLVGTWATWDDRNWLDAADGEGREFLRAATQVKNIWVPYGE